jgi:uncharacterized protein (UPF0147 family)
MPGPSSTNLDSELNIVIQFGNNVITHADLLDFEVHNAINEIPSGQFLLIDKNADLDSLKSGDFGVIIFTNTSSDKTEKMSALTFIIDEIINEDVVAANAVIRIRWSAGNKEQLKKKTRSFSGNSADAITDIFEVSNAKKISFPDVPKPTDNMVWRYVQENMWEQLFSAVNKSFFRNDYLFWAWDDVNDAFKISSLNIEDSVEDRYIIMQSTGAMSSTEMSKVNLDNPKFTIWYYDGNRQMNDLGRNKDKLFPNVSFSGIRDTDLLSTGLRKATFSEMLREIGDTKYDDVLKSTDMNEVDDVFGDFKMRRHWPNNVHKMYSFADIYREYKISTCCKVLSVRIYNNVGPSLGSKVTVFKASDDYLVRGMSMDVNFSDKYYVQEKLIIYKPSSELTPRGPKTSNKPLVTILKLISDNFAKTGEEHIAKISKQLESFKT